MRSIFALWRKWRLAVREARQREEFLDIDPHADHDVALWARAAKRRG